MYSSHSDLYVSAVSGSKLHPISIENLVPALEIWHDHWFFGLILSLSPLLRLSITIARLQIARDVQRRKNAAKWDVSREVGRVPRHEHGRSKTAACLTVDGPGHSELTRLVPMVPS